MIRKVVAFAAFLSISWILPSQVLLVGALFITIEIFDEISANQKGFPILFSILSYAIALGSSALAVKFIIDQDLFTAAALFLSSLISLAIYFLILPLRRPLPPEA